MDLSALAVDVRAEIDRELALVDSAIALVRASEATRVTVANLPLAGSVLQAAQARGRLRGVRVIPLWGDEVDVIALAIEPGDGTGGRRA